MVDDRSDPNRSTLGAYLRLAREKAGLSQGDTEEKAKPEAKRRKWRDLKVSASLIGAYEADKVDRPDPRILRILASVYGTDYLELLIPLVFDRYQAHEEFEFQKQPLLAQARRELWEASLHSRDDLRASGEGPDLEVAQLLAKALVVRDHVILDIDGIVKWESESWKDTPAEHKQFWVVIPEPAAFEEPRIRRAVVSMVDQSVKLTYFVPQKNKERDSFGVARLREEVRAELGLSKERADALIQRVELSVEHEALVTTTDIVIAKPRGNAIGFATIRRNRTPEFCILLDHRETQEIVGILQQNLPRDDAESAS